MDRCPYCNDQISANVKVIRCPQCSRLYHLDCWESNNNHCAVFNCPGATALATAPGLIINNTSPLKIAGIYEGNLKFHNNNSTYTVKFSINDKLGGVIYYSSNQYKIHKSKLEGQHIKFLAVNQGNEADKWVYDGEITQTNPLTMEGEFILPSDHFGTWKITKVSKLSPSEFENF